MNRRSAFFAASILALAPALTPACAAGVDPTDSAPADDAEQPEALPSEELDRAAVQALAARDRISAGDLEILSAADASYPALGRVTREVKLLDRSDGSVRGISVDPTGEEVLAAELQREEREARFAAERRLSPPLAARLASAGDEELIDVAIWLKEPPSEGPARPAFDAKLSRRDMDDASSKIEEDRAARVRALTAPVQASIRALGFDVEADRTAPLLHASLTRDAIERLRDAEEVDRIYLPVINEPMLFAERQAIFAHVVNNRGINGSGVNVAAIEVGGKINTANPFLAGASQNTTYSCMSSHSAAVGGILTSTHSTETGVAPGAALFVSGSCGGAQDEIEFSADVAVLLNARALNLSFGYLALGLMQAQDRYYDSLVINNFRTVVAAAGNDGNGWHVSSPGTAYNVIAVGAYDEATHQMAGFSSGADPGSTHGDREKPEVAAPGVDFISTTNASPFIGSVGSGTSFAAPMVTGTAALLMDRNAALQMWPEAVKAILMATAWNNIEGSGRLSELDGAGAIFADDADLVAGHTRGDWVGVNYPCFTATDITVLTMSLTAGQRVRAAIAWDTDPNYSDYDLRPSADLDLLVDGPSGGVVASSSSFDNNYEIVDFVAPSTGTHAIRVHKFRCDESPRYLGAAFFKI
jgi:hypothetical protein